MSKGSAIQKGGLEDFTLISGFTSGYRNREDRTILPPGILVQGSQNVLTNTYQRVGIRKGYTLDGQSSTVLAPILSAFDWPRHTGDVRHLRAGFLTSAGNDGKNQFRYVATANGQYWNGHTFSEGDVYWIDLMTSLTSVSFNYANFWDFNKELKDLLLFVDGSQKIYEWSGGVTTFASATATTITKQGTRTWAEEGFYNLNYSLGDATTQFDVTNPVGTTFRYTYDGTGTDPLITATLMPVGQTVYIFGTNLAAGNSGVFTVTGSGTNYFEVTNASGVVESNKTINTGFINYFVNKIVGPDGTVYTYGGGAETTTLTQVTPNPTLGAYTPGGVFFQQVKFTPNTGLNDFPEDFDNALIANLRNQIYVGSLTNNSVYISKVNNYKDYAYTQPVRVVGEGAVVTLDGAPTALVPQETQMNMFAGQDQIYETQFTLSADLAKEDFQVIRQKTTKLQGAQSQAWTTKIKNNVAFLSFEPIINTYGRVDNVVLTQQTSDISYPIVNDMNTYDFGDGSLLYDKMFIYVAVPKEGKFLMYNMTDPKNIYWESPQIASFSRFSLIDGSVYAHSYQTSETYKLFDGYNDNGAPINAIAKFSFNNYGTRSSSKAYNQFYNEGYISPNTTLTLGIQHEIDGCARYTSYNLRGINRQFVCAPVNDASLGKTSQGWHGLGTNSFAQSANAVPPKFRWIRTFPIDYFYEDQISYSSNGVDQQWEILAFGPQLLSAKDLNNAITE